MRLLIPVLLVLLSGCSAPRSPELPDRSDFLSAWDSAQYPGALTALERGLIEARDLQMTYKVSSQGAFTASISGRLDLRADADTLVTGVGTFGGQPVDLLIVARGDSLFGGNGGNRFAISRPAELRDAMVIGLTRMGILHNLARLTTGAPPDHGEGGVRKWVLPMDVTRSEAAQQPSAPEGDSIHTFRFDIQVSGTRSGSAALTFRRASGLPRMRLQEVAFQDGMMLVREEYSWQR